MKAVWFRWKETGWVGLALGRDMREVFWQVDHYGDPNEVEIMPAEVGSFCMRQEEDDQEIEVNDEVIPDEGVWMKPEWPTV